MREDSLTPAHPGARTKSPAACWGLVSGISVRTGTDAPAHTRGPHTHSVGVNTPLHTLYLLISAPWTRVPLPPGSHQSIPTGTVTHCVSHPPIAPVFRLYPGVSTFRPFD